eukprot:3907948-Prorocentrum_lima.AAC.1
MPARTASHSGLMSFCSKSSRVMCGSWTTALHTLTMPVAVRPQFRSLSSLRLALSVHRQSQSTA